MNIVLCLSHSIEEYDQLRLLSGLGYEVFSIGGYIDPANPHSTMRPALPEVPRHPELQAAVDALGTADNLGAAQACIPDAILDWADVIIYHHYLDRLYGQWDRVKHKRVIWRTVGQSVEGNERAAQPFRDDGLQIVRYSPKERNLPGYAGEDALIRFYKDPADYGGWTGEDPTIINVTQDLYKRSLDEDGLPRGRQEWTNYSFWDQATAGLPRMPLGPGSEAIGGPGELTNDEMVGWLRRARVYLYTGTQPASYTLGLIEAMMTGIPVVSIGPQFMDIFPYGPELFEGHEIAGNCGTTMDGHVRSNERVVANTRQILGDFLAKDLAWESNRTRTRAIELFGRDMIGAQWKAFLG